MSPKKSPLMPLIVILILAVVLLITLNSEEITGFVVNPPYVSGNWSINPATSGSCVDETLVINGDVEVQGGDANLTLINCTLVINSTYDGQYGFYIYPTSSLWMNGSSVIKNGGDNGGNASARYIFLADSPTEIFINDSFIYNAGINSTANFSGVHIEGRPLYMNNTVIVGGYNGLVLYGANTTTSQSIVDNSNISFAQGADGIYAVETFVNVTNTVLNNNTGDGIEFVGPEFHSNISWNTIKNNSGYGVKYVAASPNDHVLRNNTICYNTQNGTFPDNSGSVVFGNQFCVTGVSPVGNGITNNKSFTFTVSNPLAVAASPPFAATCNLFINGSSEVSGTAFATDSIHTLTISNYTLPDGFMNWTVNCDPYNNIGNMTTENSTLDNETPSEDTVTSTGQCSGSTWQRVLSVSLQDNEGLSYAILETNETGSAANKTGSYGSPYALSGTSDTAQFTWSNSSKARYTPIGWRVFANDTAGNWMASTLSSFLVDICETTTPATSGSTGTGVRDPAVYDFDVIITDNDLDLTDGTMKSTTVDVTNTGNAVIKGMSVLVSGLPDNISVVASPSPFDLPFGGSTDVSLAFTPTGEVAPGTYTVSIDVSGAGTTKSAELDLYVGGFPFMADLLNESLSIGPGNIGVTGINITNLLEDSIDIAISTTGKAAEWTEISPAAGTLGAGTSGTAAVYMFMPEDATGDSSVNITVSSGDDSMELYLEVDVIAQCPVCPDPSETECSDGKRSITYHACSESTNFACIASTQEVDCEISAPVVVYPVQEYVERKQAEAAKKNIPYILVAGVLGAVVVAAIFTDAFRVSRKKSRKK